MNGMRIPEARELTSEERLLLEHLLRHGTREATAYLEQMPRVTVVSRCGCGCPTIDLAVGGQTAPPGSGSTILCDALGVSPEGVRFGIILHAREGLLSELEVYPTDGDAVFSLPPIDCIEFYGAE